jgi:hypothetical protein
MDKKSRSKNSDMEKTKSLLKAKKDSSRIKHTKAFSFKSTIACMMSRLGRPERPKGD